MISTEIPSEYWVEKSGLGGALKLPEWSTTPQLKTWNESQELENLAIYKSYCHAVFHFKGTEEIHEKFPFEELDIPWSVQQGLKNSIGNFDFVLDFKEINCMEYGELNLLENGCHWEISLIGEFAPEFNRVFKIEWDAEDSMNKTSKPGGVFQAYFDKTSEETLLMAGGDKSILPDLTFLRLFEDETGYEMQSGLISGYEEAKVCLVNSDGCELPTIMRVPNDNGVNNLIEAVEGFLTPHFLIFESILGGDDQMDFNLKLANVVVYSEKCTEFK